jgi:hypothetical protein
MLRSLTYLKSVRMRCVVLCTPLVHGNNVAHCRHKVACVDVQPLLLRLLLPSLLWHRLVVSLRSAISLPLPSCKEPPSAALLRVARALAAVELQRYRMQELAHGQPFECFASACRHAQR